MAHGMIAHLGFLLEKSVSHITDWFGIDYTYENGVYHDMVECDAKSLYKERKSDLHDHLKENGGLEQKLYKIRSTSCVAAIDSHHGSRSDPIESPDVWRTT
ncbi:hypothetical protein PHJA_002559600 [Phtheirospermum japonicum]|uniref:Uncharacterized protein n=1 Tax=Phtheirospermum japonicum TaxID=374723 RepID=A0A830CY40_9LAMI|nr:hypothetical protein PHJA_002559600 [Phtheirospermum japonicum]